MRGEERWKEGGMMRRCEERRKGRVRRGERGEKGEEGGWEKLLTVH